MRFGDVSFSVASHAAWAPGLATAAAWQEWAQGRRDISVPTEPPLHSMPPMLRRRASAAGRMALEAAYECLPEHAAIPIIFASRHGECARSVELLRELANQVPLSPASFSLSVHNATAGLFSIARGDHGNHIAIAAGPATIEYALIEACALLADGVTQVLLVVSDSPPPAVLSIYNDAPEESFAWAWLLQKLENSSATTGDRFSLSWSAHDQSESPLFAIPDMPSPATMPAGLEILRFFLRRDLELKRAVNGRLWRWSRHA